MTISRRTVRVAAFSLVAAGVLLVSIAAASSVLFTQTFPSVPNAPPGSITASCSSLQAWDGPVPAGGGSVLFNCTGQVGAFTVANAPATATPTFTLPTNATDLYVVPAYPSYSGPDSACASDSSAIPLTNASSVTLSTGGNWDYCIDAAGSLTSFSISWS